MTDYHKIPVELREYHQWVVWKREETVEGKPTKIPYSVKNPGRKASVTNPDDWCAFHEAVIAAQGGAYDGIGFVLTKEDPFAFIDLDTPKDVDAETFKGIQDRQNKVFDSFKSYAEYSPSGSGAHIIVKGAVSMGRKRSSIEVYSESRYMTMTGSVIPSRSDVGVQDHHDLLNVLWGEMGNKVEYLMHDGNSPQREDDDVVIAKASSAINGEKFLDLGRDGNWMKYYTSQSEGDFALIDILAFYTQNREQIIRIFRSSKLGERFKAQRKDYCEYMVSKAFDRLLPPIDTDGLYNAIQEQLAKQKGEAFIKQERADNVVATASGGEFELPPGLLGEIAKFIYSASPRPVPQIALAGAIGLMAGITGRAYNVSATGLNHYVLLLAGTGRGKEGIASGISTLIHKVAQTSPTTVDYFGPGEIASPQGLLKWLSTNSQCFVSVVGEFGDKLAEMTGPRASSNMSSLRRTLLDLYNKSGRTQTFNGSAYSNSDKNVKIIRSPAFSFIGESNPGTFYASVNEETVSNGLMPRLTIIEYTGIAVPFNENAAFVQPSEYLVSQMASLVASCTMLANNGQTIDVALNDEAKQLSQDLARQCDHEINKQLSGVVPELWNRVHLRTLKLASLYAVGVNPYMPVIDPQAFEWARKIIVSGVIKVISRFEKGSVGVAHNEVNQINELIRFINDYYKRPYSASNRITEELFSSHVISYKYLWDRAKSVSAFYNDRLGAKAAIERTIKTMIETEQLADVTMQMKSKNGNSSMRLYMLADRGLLKND